MTERESRRLINRCREEMNGPAYEYHDAYGRLAELESRLLPLQPSILTAVRLLLIAVIAAAYLIDRQLLPSVVTYLVSFDNTAWAGFAVNVIPAAIILLELWISLAAAIDASKVRTGSGEERSIYDRTPSRLQLSPGAHWTLMKLLILLVQPAAAFAMYHALELLNPAAHEANLSLLVFMVSIAVVSHLAVLTSGPHLLALMTGVEQRSLRITTRRARNALLNAERTILFHYRNLRELVEEHNHAFPERPGQMDLDPRTAETLNHILNGGPGGQPSPPTGPGPERGAGIGAATGGGIGADRGTGAGMSASPGPEAPFMQAAPSTPHAAAGAASTNPARAAPTAEPPPLIPEPPNPYPQHTDDPAGDEHTL